MTDPRAPRLVAGQRRSPGATHSASIVARTYAYVAAGQDGLVIVDVERPEARWSIERFDADGKLQRRARRRSSARPTRRCSPTSPTAQRPQGGAAHSTRHPAQVLRLQPGAASRSSSPASNRQAALAFREDSSGPRRRRNRASDRRLRPQGLAAAEHVKHAPTLPQRRRQALVRTMMFRRTPCGRLECEHN